MAKPIRIPIDVPYQGKGAAQAAKDIAAIEKASIAAQKSIATYTAAAARTAAANDKIAASSQKVAQAQARTAGEVAKADAAMSRAALSALRYQQAVEKSTKPPGKGLTAYFDSLKSDAMSAAGAMVGFGAAIQGAIAIAQSFSDAFNFKASLDATTLAVNAQLKGVRDSGQVWSEAASFANTYKLTQEETTQAVAASIGVMRNSKAPIEDILGVLARMQVLSPEQSLEEAAIALKSLASGDTTSLVTRFEVGRDVANQMKQEIAGGADAVAVMSQFLGETGIGMDVLASKTTGASGAIKDAARAAEDLKMAQAEWAEGPGLAVLERQIDITTGLTRALGGGGGLAEAQKNVSAEVAGSLAHAQAYIGALAEGKTQAEAQVIALTAQRDAIGEVLFAQQGGTSGGKQWGEAQDGATQSAQAGTAALTEEAQAAMVNQVNTQALAIEKDRLTEAAQIAAGAVLASGGDIVGEAARLAASSSLIDKLTAAYLRLAIAQGQALGASRLGGQAKNTTDLTGGRGPVAGAPGRKGAGDDQIAKIAASQAAASKAAADAERARSQQILTTGSAAQKVAEQQRIYNETVKKFGPTSAEAIDAETALIQAKNQGAGASSKAGKAAQARANAEASAADKIMDIAEATADKLIEIDEKAAKRRAEAVQGLANSIRGTAADLIADQEANDLDIIGASEEQMAGIRAREEAEAQARIATIEAISEARRIADEGDAELAQDVLDQRTEAISKQQALDEEYNAKKEEFASDPAALEALKKEYDEATAAAQAATQVRIDLAKQEAQQRIDALAAEKQAVLDDAVARAAAMDSTGKNAATAQERVDALSRALASIPTAVTTTVTVNEVKRGGGGESSGGGASTAPPAGGNSVEAAGGGTFLATSETKFRVGEAGPEVVSVTPLTGGGRTSMSGSGVLSMAGGGSAVVDDAAADAIDALTNAPGAAIPAARAVSSGGGGGGGGGGASAPADFKEQLDQAKAAIDLLDAMAELRSKLASIGPPLDMDLVNQLAGEALDAASALGAKFTLLSKEQAENFEIFTDTIGNALSALSDAASLRNDLVDIGPPMDQRTVARLASEAEQALYSIDRLLRPIAEQQADAIGRFTDSASNALSLLSDAASLREDTAELGGPIDPAMVARLASEARAALDIIQGTLAPIGEEEAEAVDRYAESVGASVDALGSALDLSAQRFLDYQSPSDAQLGQVAEDARRFVAAMDAAARAYSTEGLEAAKAFAEGAGAAYSAVGEGLTTIDKLRFSDISVDPAQLAAFEASSAQILDTIGSIATKAATLPDLGAINGASAALTSWSEAQVALAAVPGGLGQMAGSSSSSLSIAPGAITIYQQPGQDGAALANQVMGVIKSRWSSHR